MNKKMNKILEFLNAHCLSAYWLVFSIYKKIKYPTCSIHKYISCIEPTVRLGKEVIINRGTTIFGDVEIGDHTYINVNTDIHRATSKIGKYCSISLNVKIGMGPHPLERLSTSPIFYSKNRGYLAESIYNGFEANGSTEIGNDVFIASGVTVYAGVKVGDGAVIAAGSVVTKEVPPYAVMGGIPAKVLRYRFEEETIKNLLESMWWEMDLSALMDVHQKMDTPEHFLEAIAQKRAGSEGIS